MPIQSVGKRELLVLMGLNPEAYEITGTFPVDISRDTISVEYRLRNPC